MQTLDPPECERHGNLRQTKGDPPRDKLSDSYYDHPNDYQDNSDENKLSHPRGTRRLPKYVKECRKCHPYYRYNSQTLGGHQFLGLCAPHSTSSFFDLIFCRSFLNSSHLLPPPPHLQIFLRIFLPSGVKPVIFKPSAPPRLIISKPVISQ